MSRPPCHYCDGTGWNDEAVRVDVDDYRGAECEWCEGTGEAMHSANTNTARPPRDALASLRFSRKHGKATLRRIRQQGLAKTDNGFDPYLNVKRHAIGDRRPLAQLRMIEAAIGCDVTCRAAVATWRNAA